MGLLSVTTSLHSDPACFFCVPSNPFNPAVRHGTLQPSPRGTEAGIRGVFPQGRRGTEDQASLPSSPALESFLLCAQPVVSFPVLQPGMISLMCRACVILSNCPSPGIIPLVCTACALLVTVPAWGWPLRGAKFCCQPQAVPMPVVTIFLHFVGQEDMRFHRVLWLCDVADESCVLRK